LKRAHVAAIPFLASLGLSLSTVGSNVYWQDSGVFLSAVKDAGILYPPGFVFYVVACKIWTLTFSFLDFTLAVHLFSAACVAGACSLLALATREMLRTRGPVFRTGEPDESPMGDACAAAAGCLAAGGFTFWFTGIYAKGYALYYLVLASLLLALVLADGDRTPRAFRRLAVLIGLAWAAHPSSACLAPALLLFVARHRHAIRGREWARGAGIAAGVALGPSLIVLPILAALGPVTALGDPRSFPELLDYALGLRFMGRPGAFGVDPDRMATFGLFLWEEFLGVGLGLLAAGMVSLVGVNGGLLAGILAWSLPYSLLALLFKVEGQHDCWFVAAWLPFHLLVGLGLRRVAILVPPPSRWAVVAVLPAAGLAWAVAANRADLDQRTYTLAEAYGRILLDPVDRDAIVVLNGDDALAITGYLQRVKGRRPDVVLVALPFLGQGLVGGRDWYDEKLLRERPFLGRPDYAGARGAFPGARPLACHLAAFLHANARRGRELFTQASLPPAMLPSGMTLIPAGALWKLVPIEGQRLEFKYWQFPVDLPDVQHRLGRKRGLELSKRGDQLVVRQEAYEERLVDLLLRARHGLGDLLVKAGKGKEALAVLVDVGKVDPAYLEQSMFLLSLGRAFAATGQDRRAGELLREALALGLPPGPQGWALFTLGELASGRGDAQEAEARFVEAGNASGGDPELLGCLEAKRPPQKPAPK
jgi:hypothetical protein